MIVTQSDTLLTVAQTARLLGLKQTTIRKWLSTRKLSFVKLRERAVRIPLTEIRNLIERGFVPRQGD